MQVLLRLFNMEIEAADGSKIPRSSVEKYLQSEDYKTIIRDHLALGGVTHKDRKVEAQYSDIIGPDDQILISENATHYITKIYVKDNDPYCYAIVEVLDPENYSGERKANIQNLIGDLKSGVVLPCSVVIQAMWSYDNIATEIIRIKGVDFTLNPSFKGSGIEKVFSVHKEVQKIERNDTESNAVLTFSSTVQIMDQTIYSKSDIAKKFGLNSKEYKAVKLLDDNEKVTEDELNRIIDNAQLPKIKTVAEEHAIVPDLTKDYPEGYWDEGEEKDLSQVTSVRDRMYLIKYPRITKINQVLRGYKLYYKERGNVITPEEMKVLVKLLTQDLSIMIREVAMDIKQGKFLSQLYALQQFGDQRMVDAAKKLSTAYRYVLLSEERLGFIPETKYVAWKAALREFYEAMVKYCFGESTNVDLTINEIN